MIWDWPHQLFCELGQFFNEQGMAFSVAVFYCSGARASTEEQSLVNSHIDHLALNFSVILTID